MDEKQLKEEEIRKQIIRSSQELEDDFYLTQVIGIPLKSWQRY